MKTNRSRTGMVMLMVLVMLSGSVGTVTGAPSNPPMTGASGMQNSQAATLEKVTFAKVNGKERVILTLSRQVGALVEEQPGNIILIRMNNLSVPQSLRRPLGEGALNNLIRVVPEEKVYDNRQQAVIRIELNKLVPYRIGQEENGVVVDFNVASLPGKAVASGEKSAVREPPPKPLPVAEVKATKLPDPVRDAGRYSPPPVKPAYPTQRVSIDFQDASIKSVLKLLAEEGRVNIVYGDDIKGNVTVSLQNISWEQALDTVLEINDMTRLQEGDIIRVITKTKLSDVRRRADDETIRLRKAADEKEKQEQAKKAETGKLQQVMIEAKIVEVSTTFVRKLGVQWGGNYTGNLRAAKGVYPYGVGIGTNPSTTTTNLLPVGSGIGLTETGLGVNLPAAIASPTIGLVLGSANAVISAQIAALETTSEGRIISTPRVVIMEGEKAIIKQGEEIPVVTPASATSPATTTYKPAELRLEVTPKITSDGRISMTITAQNNRPNRAEKDPATGNMPIFTNQVDSKVVIRDGDTIVIGGVLKSEETKAEAGVPWIYKIPVLGWLFKQEDLEKAKRELLIFVTPKIVKTATVS